MTDMCSNTLCSDLQMFVTNKKRKNETKEKPSVCVGIIGSAGRTPAEAKQMTTALYIKIVDKVIDTIVNRWKLDLNSICLTSGGSAGVDHAAVTLYLSFIQDRLASEKESKVLSRNRPHLILHLPSPLCAKVNAFEKGVQGCGTRLNQLHQQFSTGVWGSEHKLDSLVQLREAEEKGAQLVTCVRGFKRRNSSVAKQATHLIAFTFSPPGATAPVDGGTLDTWNKWSNLSPKSDFAVHFSLNDL